ncbi:MAG: hypothetical protein JW987_14435 [Anaerolineaceae bacterium]|nr:hypothetical protein [Anaerolineaceae bacterium]
MSCKLIMTWDIRPERDQEYFEFVVREFIPGVKRLGFELTDAWATIYGRRPQVMVGASLPTLGRVTRVLQSDDWQRLYDQLMDFVQNYDQKVVETRGGFQF